MGIDIGSDDIARAAAAMTQLDSCPACAGTIFRDAFTDNDLTRLSQLPDALRRSDYRLCCSCMLVFAAWRQVPEAAVAYYDLFPDLEHRHYAVYPPPDEYRANKARVAQWIVGELETAGALRDNQRVLHIRSDCGSLGPALRDRYPGTTVVGQDYFDSNVRFANEAGNVDARLLKPTGAELLEDSAFDIVVINHMFTHALDPRSDLDIYLKMLKPDGTIFTYNEIDFYEALRFGGRHFRTKPVNNYHKQLFTPRSLQRFFAAAGLEMTGAGRRRNTLSACLKHNPAVWVKPAGQDELDDMTRRLDAWLEMRSSFKGKVVSWSPVRAVLKAIASPPPVLPS